VAISIPSSTVDRDGVGTVEGYGLAGDGPFDGLSVSEVGSFIVSDKLNLSDRCINHVISEGWVGKQEVHSA
jgi:hypothetical protein